MVWLVQVVSLSASQNQPHPLHHNRPPPHPKRKEEEEEARRDEAWSIKSLPSPSLVKPMAVTNGKFKR